MDFVGNLLLFAAVKEFWKSVKNLQSYHHEFGVILFGTQCRRIIQLSDSAAGRLCRVVHRPSTRYTTTLLLTVLSCITSWSWTISNYFPSVHFRLSSDMRPASDIVAVTVRTQCLLTTRRRPVHCYLCNVYRISTNQLQQPLQSTTTSSPRLRALQGADTWRITSRHTLFTWAHTALFSKKYYDIIFQ